MKVTNRVNQEVAMHDRPRADRTLARFPLSQAWLLLRRRGALLRAVLRAVGVVLCNKNDDTMSWPVIWEAVNSVAMEHSNDCECAICAAAAGDAKAMNKIIRAAQTAKSNQTKLEDHE